uniref:Uncharacterized protein n=1 Tax=Myoviridae sp. ctBCv9 TaxID=2825045 RepID=A0A8S5U6F3_9CAUD|nr:MAG TPA: hypothetical protein [Myoviridae sp. ctBCv9]
MWENVHSPGPYRNRNVVHLWPEAVCQKNDV